MLETDHFIIRYQQGDEFIAQDILHIAEDAYTFDTEFMGFEPEEKIGLTVLSSGIPLYQSYGYFRHFGMFGTVTGEHIVIVAPPEWSTELNDNYALIRYAVAHELVHILYCEMVADMLEPAWLQEGLAVYVGFTFIGEDVCTYAHVKMVFDEGEPSLDQLYHQSPTVYGISSTIIECMIEKFGKENFRVFLKTLEEWDLTMTSTQNIERALEKAYGLTYQEFEEEWLSFLHENYLESGFTGEPVTLIGEKVTDTEWAEIACSYSDGKLVLVSDEKYTIRICSMGLDSSQKKFLTSNRDYNVSDPRWSPDGTKILYTSKESGNYDVYIMNADGTGEIRLTTYSGIDIAGCWYPNRIAFTSTRSGNYDIFMMREDGTNIQQLTFNPSKEGSPDFSPDGEKIVFVSDRDGNYDIFVMNADGSHVQQLTKTSEDESFPRFSPDGKRIVFVRKNFRITDIVVMDADGSNEEVVYDFCNYDGIRIATMAPRFPIWISNERIAFTVMTDIYVVDIDGDNTVIVGICGICGIIIVTGYLLYRKYVKQKRSNMTIRPNK